MQREGNTWILQPMGQEVSCTCDVILNAPPQWWVMEWHNSLCPPQPWVMEWHNSLCPTGGHPSRTKLIVRLWSVEVIHFISRKKNHHLMVVRAWSLFPPLNWRSCIFILSPHREHVKSLPAPCTDGDKQSGPQPDGSHCSNHDASQAETNEDVGERTDRCQRSSAKTSDGLREWNAPRQRDPTKTSCKQSPSATVG